MPPTFDGTPHCENLDIPGAIHPQTILAWGRIGQDLSIGHGAPLRLREERRLGYRPATYVMAVEAIMSLAGIGEGTGGTWEDTAGSQWFGGI